MAVQGDSTNLDTGAGEDSHAVIAVGLPADGGHVVGGTSTDPFRTDPTGTTPQPVTDGGDSLTIDTPQLPATLDAGNLRVAVESFPAAALNVADGGGSLTVDSAQLPATLDAGNFRVSIEAQAAPLNVSDGSGSLTVDSLQLPATLDAGNLRVNIEAQASALSIQDGGNIISVDDAAGSLTIDSAQLPATLDTGNLRVAIEAQAAALTVADGGGSLSVDDNAGSLTVDTTQLPATLDAGNLRVAIEAQAAAISIQDGGNSITVDGTVTANAGTGPWPVTDNSGSLTVDTPQLPASLVGGRLDENVGAWLGSTSPTVGQKTMSASLPVAVASDQSTLPVRLIAEISTYAASTNGEIGSPISANTVSSLAYLFHPSANTKRIEIQKISLTWAGNAGNNPWSMRGAFISAENATPGGTSQTINALDRADAASTCVFRTEATGAPTRVTGDLLSCSGIGTSSGNMLLFDSSRDGKGIILRASVAEGFEIRFVVGSSNISGGGMRVAINFVWKEV